MFRPIFTNNPFTRWASRLVLACCLLPAATPAIAAEEKNEGIRLYQNQQYHEAAPLLKRAAIKGNAKAQAALGLMYMEGLGVSVFNSSTAITLCDDKTLTHLALHGFPVPPTVLCPLTFPGNGYGDFSFLDRAAEAVGYPMVIKEGCGSLGQQVYLARDRREAADILQRIGGATALMQRFVRESAGRDKRLYMVDGQCAAAIERRNSADFRANIAAGGSAMPYRPTEAEVRLARDCCDRLGLVFAGVDLLDGSDGTLVCEVNSNAHFTALEQATGADIAGAILSAVRRRL